MTIRTLLFAALWMLAIVSMSPQQSEAQLVGYWNFDGTVEDLSGLENHGQLVDAQYSDNVPSVIGSGQSLDFSVDTDHVLIEAHESLDSPTFTLAMFAYDRGQTGALERLTSREGDTFETAINVHPPFNGMGEYAYYSPISGNGWEWGETVAAFEQWQHVAYVATEDEQLLIYVDGELAWESEPWTVDPSGFMHIGNRWNDVEGFDGLIDNVALWNEPLDADSIRALAEGGSVLSDERPATSVGPRGAIGSHPLKADRTNQVFSEPSADTASGLGQSWYAVANPGSKEGVDAIFQTTERAVPYFQAESGITWWSGSDDVADVPKYPSEVDGVITGNNYTVKLEGEILIEESGPIRFLDGVDDFTYLAIDLDRSGTAGDSDEEVLVNDNAWTNSLSVGNGGAPIVEVDFENIADDGEWLAIEFNMAEGGGGDHGMLYWDAFDEDDFFPLDQGDGVLDIDAAVFMIPDTHLRSPVEPAQVVSGDAVGTVPGRQAGWEIDVNPADGTADTFTVENPDENIFSTVVDLDGIVFTVNPLGEVTDGSSFRIVDADAVVGTPTIATEGWTYDSMSGSLVFGELPAGIAGDIDGNGTVEFADFLILSGSFGQVVEPGTLGDIDNDGTVAFADFLILSGNFGEAAAVAVPEPSGRWLVGVAVLCAGLRRRRR